MWWYRVIIRVVLFGVVAVHTPQQAWAQLINDNEYNREFSFGLMAHPRGVGLDLRFGRYISEGRVEYLEAEFLSIRHPKEIRIFNTGITNTSPYTYGKANSAYIGRLGYGNKFMLSEKKLKNTASISFNVAAGPVFAVLKPVYLDLLVTDVNNNNFVVTKKVTAGAEINQNDVIGNSPFSKGFNELSFRVGGFAKAGFNFDWGDFTDEIKAIEVGVYVDAFPQRLPLMLHTENKYFFPSFYICAVFGSKW
ncbi:hypothetical protein QQ054_36620 [Oscillatoria amoena NRMC-F 0135]|nr:hypothetical protein [Oscillatoria amoena NRMC-F 0135]